MALDFLKNLPDFTNITTNGAPSGGYDMWLHDYEQKHDIVTNFKRVLALNAAKPSGLSPSEWAKINGVDTITGAPLGAMTATQSRTYIPRGDLSDRVKNPGQIKDIKPPKISEFENPSNWSKFNNFAGGAVGQAINVGTSLIANAVGNRTYEGKEGHITQDMDAAYDTVQSAISNIPGFGQAAGMIMGANKMLNNVMSKIGGGTDGVTKTDAILGSAFLAPIGWINGFGGKTADTYTRNQELDANTNGGFLGFLTTQNLTEIGAGKKYGLFSRGAMNKLNKLTEFTLNMKHTVSGIVDANTINTLAAQGSTPFVANQQSVDIGGGVQQMRAARQGMKIIKGLMGIPKIKPIKLTFKKTFNPKQFGPEGMIQMYDKDGNPTRGLTYALELGWEPVVKSDGTAGFIGYDSNPALPYMKAARKDLYYGKQGMKFEDLTGVRRALSLYRVGGLIGKYQKGKVVDLNDPRAKAMNKRFGYNMLSPTKEDIHKMSNDALLATIDLRSRDIEEKRNKFKSVPSDVAEQRVHPEIFNHNLLNNIIQNDELLRKEDRMGIYLTGYPTMADAVVGHMNSYDKKNKKETNVSNQQLDDNITELLNIISDNSQKINYTINTKSLKLPNFDEIYQNWLLNEKPKIDKIGNEPTIDTKWLNYTENEQPLKQLDLLQTSESKQSQLIKNYTNLVNSNDFLMDWNPDIQTFEDYITSKLSYHYDDTTHSDVLDDLNLFNNLSGIDIMGNDFNVAYDYLYPDNISDLNSARNYYQKLSKDLKRAFYKNIILKRLQIDSTQFYKQGGKVNVIPEGALHARLHHLDEVDETLNEKNITTKGIPVITQEEGGEIVLHAEIEREEIIFNIDVTNKLEKLRKEDTDESAIEAGKLLVDEIMNNTIDNTGNLI